MYKLNLTTINTKVDPKFSFITLDHDEKIRMDCSSPNAMNGLLSSAATSGEYDILTGNDADADRHGIIIANSNNPVLMNPNHYLAVAISYLFGGARPDWSKSTKVGKTLVSSSLIDRIVRGLGRQLYEVPVGFKWFVPGLFDGSLGFGGEESAGASFLRKNGKVWTTDKDGIIMCLLAAEIIAKTGKTPVQIYDDLTRQYGQSWYERDDVSATIEQKVKLSKLSPEQITDDELAGEEITEKITTAPSNHASIGGLKVSTQNAWFAARPSGTENIYKIYAESFKSAEHLSKVKVAAKAIVDKAIE